MAQGTCKAKRCGRTGRVHLGWCVGHYERWRKTGDVGDTPIAPVRVKIPVDALCSIPDCGEPAHCRGWCRAHYSRWEKRRDVRPDVPILKAVDRVRKPKPPPAPPRGCCVTDCGERHYIGGRCLRHHYRFDRHGDAEGGYYTYSELVRVTRILPPVDRFWARIDYDGPVPAHRPELGHCWIWLASLNANGYGQTFCFTDISQLAHRVAWALSSRPLIPGLELDHLCRTSACVRPDHIEQVEKRINIFRGNGWSARNRRKTHCPRGHAYDAANTSRNERGHRTCRACTNGTFRYNAERRGMDKQDRQLAIEYRKAIANDPCRYCGRPGTEYEHFFPVHKGGNGRWVNLTRACVRCNRSKGPRCGTWFVLRGGVAA